MFINAGSDQQREYSKGAIPRGITRGGYGVLTK